MIFYFSGTGNSAAVAKIAARELGDQAVDIIGKRAEDYDLSSEEYLGFIFPIYAWAAPEVMQQFAQGIGRTDAYTFAVGTFSNVAGMALEQFSEIVPLKGGFGIVMPDNYPVTDHIIDTKESAMEKLCKAKERVADVVRRIKCKEEVFDVKRGEDARDNTGIQRRMEEDETLPRFGRLYRLRAVPAEMSGRGNPDGGWEANLGQRGLLSVYGMPELLPCRSN